MGTCCQSEAQQAGNKAEMDIPGTMKPRASMSNKVSETAEDQFQSQNLEIFNSKHNSDNVLEIISKLKAFNWEADKTMNPTTVRVMKPVTELENGALYQGEWNDE
tara:strand:+ start:102 stop:416 length:315 start_codon:yes stop_codon:yes gene_type:complete